MKGFPSREQVERLRQQYPKGTKICCDCNHVTSVITLSGDESRIKAMLEAIKTNEYGVGSVDFEKILPMPDNIDCGNLGPKERAIYRRRSRIQRCNIR